MKKCALDIGNVWTGTAISDALGILARPYKTVKTKELIPFLHDLFTKEKIEHVIVGHPLTLKGTPSEQTLKVESVKDKLEKEFPTKKFVLWDERYTSQQADELKHATTKEEKIASHSIAAAFILDSYLNWSK